MKSQRHKSVFGSVMNMISDMALKAAASMADDDVAGKKVGDPDVDSPDMPGAKNETEMVEMSDKNPMQDSPDQDQKYEGQPDYKELTKNLLARKKPQVRQTKIMMPKKDMMSQVIQQATASVGKRGRGRPKGSKKA